MPTLPYLLLLMLLGVVGRNLRGSFLGMTGVFDWIRQGAFRSSSRKWSVEGWLAMKDWSLAALGEPGFGNFWCFFGEFGPY